MNQTNSEMPISSFTLNELITMAGGEKRPGIMGECIAANSASEMEIFRFPSRLNALIIGVGTEGETSLTSNLQEFRLKKDLHLQPQAHPAGTIQQPFQGPSYRHRPGFSQAHQHRHQTHDAAFPAIRLAPLHGTHARREPVAPEFYLDGRTGTERLRDGLFERDHRRTDRRDDLQGRGHPDPLPHGASRGRQPDTQPCGGVFQAVHRAARRTLQARTQRGILRPAAMHHAQIPHHAHQAHQRQIGIGMDRQLRDP